MFNFTANWLLEKIIAFSLAVVQLIISPFRLQAEFVSKIDNAIAFLIDILRQASWLIPLDVAIACVIAVFAVTHWMLFIKIIKFLVSLIPGVG